ncbi:helix-turn-helix transcriptional regulator [Streptomyces sp. NPDC054786]
MTSNELGGFLRAHRSQVLPEDVGMPSHGRRRVAGLRREEVAVLAGMNADYYARLEQGRERHPSPQVLDALSRALRLDDDGRTHLHRLAGVAPDPLPAARGREAVDPALRQLIDTYAHTPAFLLDPALDILAANALAKALFSPFERADNLARMVFLDPAGRQFYPRWNRTAEVTVANLRQAVGSDPHAPRPAELIRTLSAASAAFTELWHSHTVRGKTHDAKEFIHPEVGGLSLTYQAFDVRGAPGLQLVIYQAEPGSPSAEALSLLGTLSATGRQITPARGGDAPSGSSRR